MQLQPLVIPRRRPPRVKLVILGDGAVGKTCLLISYCKGHYPTDYVPTVFENYVEDVRDVKGRIHEVALWDTAGGEDYPRLRPLCYPDTDIFLICFDISDRTSFDNIKSYWIPELDYFIPEVHRLIVGCKADLRQTLTETSGDASLVSYDDARELAKELGTSYVETSAKERKGMDTCFLEALRLSSLGSRVPKRKTVSIQTLVGQMWDCDSDRKTAPILPTRERPPTVDIEPSTFSEDWQRALEESTHSDVIFVTPTKYRLKANKVVLCSASGFFCNLFDVPTTGNKKTSPRRKGDNEKDKMKHEPVTLLSGISTHKADDMSGEQTIIELESKVTTELFRHVLHFLYTGNPGFPDDVSALDLDKVIWLSQCLELPLLEMFCNNLKAEDAYLNPSISCYHMETVGRRMKELFINKTLLSDVVFRINDAEIFAHKCVLTTRSKVMEAMLSGSFKEGNSRVNEVEIPDTAEDVFLGLLQYLYTDHASIDNQNSVDILVLADRFCQSRLINLCEDFISRNVNNSGSKKSRHSDVIHLLHISRMYNAKQLDKCCLYYMSTNYARVKDHRDFLALDGATRQSVEDNQWPPLSYLQELAEYKEKSNTNKKCSIM